MHASHRTIKCRHYPLPLPADSLLSSTRFTSQQALTTCPGGRIQSSPNRCPFPLPAIKLSCQQALTACPGRRGGIPACAARGPGPRTPGTASPAHLQAVWAAAAPIREVFRPAQRCAEEHCAAEHAFMPKRRRQQQQPGRSQLIAAAAPASAHSGCCGTLACRSSCIPPSLGQAGDRGAGRSEGGRSLGARRHAPAAGRSLAQTSSPCSSAISLKNKACSSAIRLHKTGGSSAICLQQSKPATHR